MTVKNIKQYSKNYPTKHADLPKTNQLQLPLIETKKTKKSNSSNQKIGSFGRSLGFPKPYKTIGNQPIYEQQFNCANEAFLHLLKTNTFITAPPQAGKTGCVSVIMDIFKTELTYYGLQVLFFTGTGQNDLRDQNGNALDGAHPRDVLYMSDIKNKNLIDPLVDKFLVCHNADLSKQNHERIESALNLKKPIAIVIDECHNSQSFKANINKLLESVGIYINKPKNLWDSDRHLLQISATIPSFKKYKENTEHWGEYSPRCITLKVSEGYCGIASGNYDTISHRCRQIPKTLADQARQINNDFKNMDPGQAVMYQNSEKSQDKVLSNLKKQGNKFFRVKRNEDWEEKVKDIPEDTIILISAAHDKDNVSYDELLYYLKTNSLLKDHKVFITVKNYGSAGQTMPFQRLISKYIPRNDRNDASVIQRLGRSFGYTYTYTDVNDIKQIQWRLYDTHIIYVDLKIIEKYKKELNSPTDVCMSDNGIKSKKVRNPKTGKWQLFFLPRTTDLRKCIEEHISCDILKDFKYTDPTTSKTSLRIRHTSQNNAINLIGQLTKDKDGDGRQDALICIDGANKSHKESWDAFTDEVDNGTNELCALGLKSEHLKSDSEVVPVIYRPDDVKLTDYNLKKDNAKNIKSDNLITKTSHGIFTGAGGVNNTFYDPKKDDSHEFFDFKQSE